MKKNSVVKKRNGNFTVVKNEMIEHPKLSYKAKGIFMYLWSRANMSNWTYNMQDIVAKSKDGKDAVLSGIRELEVNGFVERRPMKTQGARFAGYMYVLDDTPSLGDTSQGEGTSMVDSENRGDKSATEKPLLTKEDITKEHSIVTGEPDDDLPQAFTETMLEAIEVATHLSTKLSESMENFRAPSITGLHKWAKDIDLAIRKDGRTKSQLIEVLNWVHDGSGTFWIANVRSGKKLREQFDTMWFQMNDSKPTVPVKERAREAFGNGKVFFKFVDTSNKNREVHVCLFGDYGALYDYRGNKYISKVMAEKVWKHIDKSFESIVADFKKAA